MRLIWPRQRLSLQKKMRLDWEWHRLAIFSLVKEAMTPAVREAWGFGYDHARRRMDAGRKSK